MTSDPTIEVRGLHPYVYRSGEWARIVMPCVSERGRDCWLVEFDDGATDVWVQDDSVARYEFRTRP